MCSYSSVRWMKTYCKRVFGQILPSMVKIKTQVFKNYINKVILGFFWPRLFFYVKKRLVFGFYFF